MAHREGPWRPGWRRRRRRAAWGLALALGGAGAAPAAAQVPGAAQTAPTLTRPPRVRRAVSPPYPAAAQAAHLEGDVTLRVDVAADGHVAAVAVVRGAGHGFDEAAAAALMQFAFEPAEIDGQPGAVQVEYTQHFVWAPPAAAPPAATPAAAPALRGRLLERGSRMPVVGAGIEVTVDGTPLPAATSGDDGAFAVAAPPGTAVVRVRAPAHAAYQTQEELRAGEQLQVTYYLMPSAVGGFETVVRAPRDPKEVSRRTLRRDELQSVPGSFGDALRVVQDLPGLARTPYGIGGLIVRGAAASDTGTYFDGVQLPLVFHFGAGPSVVNSEFIDRIDFYPGGFGVRYGRAIGGILDVDSRAPKADAAHGSGKVDLIDAGAYVAVPLSDEVVLSVAARRSYIDAVLKLALRGASATRIAPAYYDYQARLDVRPQALPAHRFELFFMGSDDVLAVLTAPRSGAAFQLNEHQGFQRLMAAWRFAAPALAVRAQAFVGLDENSVGIGTSQIDSPATAWGGRLDVTLTPTPALSVRAGLDAQLRRQQLQLHIAYPVRYSPFPGAPGGAAPLQAVRSSLDQDDVAAWVELEARLPFGLRLLPGLRLDAFRVPGHTHLAAQPRLVLRQPLHLWGRPTQLKASAGCTTELPPPQDLTPTFGNPDLPLQAALQLAAGAEHLLTASLGLDVTAFYSRRTRLAVPSAAVVRDAAGALQRQNVSADGVGRAYGLEVLLRQELTRNLFGWVAYTLSWSAQRDGGGLPWAATLFDERHILTLIGQYRFAGGWQLGGRLRLVTSAPSTPVVGATYAADEQKYGPIAGAPASARGPTFRQLDLRVDRLWLFNTWQLGVYLDVQNVLNTDNPDFQQYDYRYRTSQSIPDIPILPTLGLKGVF